MATGQELFVVADGYTEDTNDGRNEIIAMTPADQVDEIQRYADACDIRLDDDDARLVADRVAYMLSRIAAGEMPGSDDWYWDFEWPLIEHDQGA